MLLCRIRLPLLLAALVCALHMSQAAGQTIGDVTCPGGADIVDVPVNSDLSTGYSAVGKTYRLAAGTYKVTTPISLNAGTPGTLCYIGAGTAATTIQLQLPGPTAWAFAVTGGSDQFPVKAAFQALAIDGRGTGGALKADLYATFALNQVAIKSCPLGALQTDGSPSRISLTSTTVSSSGSGTNTPAVRLGASTDNLWSNVSVGGWWQPGAATGSTAPSAVSASVS